MSAMSAPWGLSFPGAFDSSFMVTVRLIAPFLAGLLRPGGELVSLPVPDIWHEKFRDWDPWHPATWCRPLCGISLVKLGINYRVGPVNVLMASRRRLPSVPQVEIRVGGGSL